MQFFQSLLIIVGMRITQFYLRTCRLGQASLDIHHCFHSFPGSSFIISGQLEHLTYMLLVFITNFFRLRIILQIIIPFAHAQATLHGMHHIFIAIHVISTDIQNEVRIHPSLLHFYNQRIDFSFIFDGTYFLQFGFNGGSAFLIQFYAVHSYIIKFTDFLCNAAGFMFFGSQPFNQSSQLLTVVFGEHIE